jgi:CDP-diacylglycerol---glycerol-3-phosphate 3-phosphatidyltransferase
MIQPIDLIRRIIRAGMRSVARGLNALSGGRLHPNTVTIVGLVMHVPIALLIATNHWRWLAVALLIIFGLFDALDGELARLQGKSGVRGMLLDASTDRMKETLLYSGAAYALALGPHPATAAWAAAACGASLCVSYIKAKGEAAVASLGTAIPHAELNHLFADGLLTFEVRMVLLAAGIASGYLVVFVATIAVGAALTAIGRLMRISRRLAHV